MIRKSLGVCSIVAFVVSIALAADARPPREALSAAQIVDKNVAARGGLQAWRAVQTLSLEGKLGAGGNQRATLALPGSGEKTKGMITPRRPAQEVELPFLMQLKRGRKMCFELQFAGKTAIEVYDGTNGWKLRPFLNRLEVEPFSSEEVKLASEQSDLDGYLVDYAAKGSRVEFDGLEKVEGRDSYKLKVTERNQQTHHVWIDAETFLESKIEGQPRRLDGAEHPVEVYYRDYRTVDGLEIPFVLETRVLPLGRNALGVRDTPAPPEKIIIEKVEVNPKLEESRFQKPVIPTVSTASRGK